MLGGMVGMAVQAAGYVSLGTMVTPLAAATGWTRTQIVAVAPFGAVLAPFLAPWVGTLIDRFGPRRVALGGFAAAAAGVSGLGEVGASVVGWWSLWIVIAAATFPTGALIWTEVVTQRFTRRRGLALGLVLSGMGLAAATVPLFLSWATGTIGWRGAYRALGLIVLLLGIAATLIACREAAPPRARHLAATRSVHGLTRAEALRTRRFWQLGVLLLLASGAVGCLAIHLQPMLIDRGVSMIGAATIAAAFGPAQIVGRIGAGALLDRVSGAMLGAVAFLIPIAGCLTLIGGDATGHLALVAPLAFGLAAGLELDLGSYLAGRYFGEAHFAAIFAGLFVFHVVGYTVAPLAAAYVRDTTGSYVPVLIAISAVLPAVALLCGTLGRYPAPAVDA